MAIALYFTRVVIIGLAIGVCFVRLRLFKKMSLNQTLLIGIASTPMLVSLFDYLLGFILVGAWSLLFYLLPIVFSIIIVAANKNYKLLAKACSEAKKYINEYGEGKESGRIGSRVRDVAYLAALLIFIGTYGVQSVFLIERPVLDPDRAHYELEARYFLEDKDSLAVDNYRDEKYGSSLEDDHGDLWVICLADAYIATDVAGSEETLICVNSSLLWTYFCFLLLLFLTASFTSKTYRAGIAAILLFNIYHSTMDIIFGTRDAFRFVGLLLLLLYAINQYEDISSGRAKWYEYAFMALFCYLSMEGHEGNVYLMLGMFLVFALILLFMRTKFKDLVICGFSVLAGTLLGIKETITLFLTTGNLQSSTLLPFHDTPVIDQIAELNAGRADIEAIWASYSIPVRLMMLLGVIGLVSMLVYSIWKRKRTTLIITLLICGLLLPMTGAMDWIGYDVSLWFFEQMRYRMTFLMLLAISGAWVLTRSIKSRHILAIFARIPFAAAFIAVMFFFLQVEQLRMVDYGELYLDYCIKRGAYYEDIADRAARATHGSVFTQDQALLFYLHGNPKLLYHINAEDLIQAKTEEEIKAAIEKLNIGAIVLPPNGLSYHDYALLPFWEYIISDESFGQIDMKWIDREVIIFYQEGTREV
ncbi:MAG: hypothetical protein IKE52_05375 [Mogibacterium sp.]|nr:hypothetical protein [Mogibacterium sp.]